jgi:hypothetical protein
MASNRNFFQRLRGRLHSLTPKEKMEKGAAGSTETSGKLPVIKARTPETMCGIDPKKMSREEIRARLAELYRRHNQAAGSLNDELRQEAELMLDAIVACREKYVD